MHHFSCFSVVGLVVIVLERGSVEAKSGDDFDKKRTSFDRYGLPKMFEMDDYRSCLDRYCRVDVKVKSHDVQSKIYKEIERSKHDWKHRLNREYFHRMLCIPKNISEHYSWKYSRETVSKEFSSWNSTVEVIDVRCLRPFDISNLDVIILVFSTSAIIVWYQFRSHDFLKLDRLLSNNSTSSEISNTCKSNVLENYLFSLPIIKNLENLNQQSKNPDFHRLKCIQGIRFFNTILMIIFHTKNSFSSVYLDDVSTWEDILSHPLMFLTLQAELLLVQIYFMISSFLLTNQILELHKRNGQFTIRDVAVMLLNRIARLFPPLLVVTALSIPFSKILSGPHTFDSIEMFQDECISSWWATLFQLSFIFPFHKICMPTTWYISVDTLFFLSTMILMYVKLRLNLDLKKLIAIFFVIFCATYGIVIYTGSLDILYQAYPQQFKSILHAPEFNTLYKDPLANWSTSFVGVAFGYIYFYTKTKSDKALGVNFKSVILWYLTFLALPLATVLLTTVDWTPGLQRALVGPMIRPLYAFGFGVGILGMPRGYGGFIKNLLECRTVVFLADYTYCTYVYHIVVVFPKGAFTPGLVALSFFSLICWMVFDVVGSFGLGIVTTVLVERPGIELQKTYLPQIVRKPVPHKEIDVHKDK